MRVLIADDSSVVCERLIAMLSQVEEIDAIDKVQDVAEAINSVGVLKPDAVILDIQMPDGSGIDVLKHIKKERPETVVIMLTNYPYPQYFKECMDGGADFFFDKSLEFEKAIEVCKTLAREG